MQLKIAIYGDPVLRKRAEPIEKITDEIRKLAYDMIETMDNNNGIGLAAPQVGHSIRLFVLRNYIEDAEGRLSISAEPRIYINPKLLKPLAKTCVEPEGCISVPGVNGDVERPIGITVEAMDLDGNIFVEEIVGYNARVRMHENDHINGVLYIDRMAAADRKRIEPHLQMLKKKYHP